MKSCPYYAACDGYGPADLCTTSWRKANTANPDVIEVLVHVLTEFDHYNQGDLDSTAQSRPIAKLRRYFDSKARKAEASAAYAEGAPRMVEHQRRERRSLEGRRMKERALRKKALVCLGCETNYYAIFGKTAFSVIEVHHLRPLASPQHKGATRRKDLVLLCANCHRLVHASAKRFLTLRALRELLARRPLRASLKATV